MKEKTRKFIVGTKVQWMWMGRAIEGLILEIHTEPIVKTIKGKAIKRNGSQENPACVVQSVSGNLALKLQSELELLSLEKKSSASRPKIFSGKGQ